MAAIKTKSVHQAAIVGLQRPCRLRPTVTYDAETWTLTKSDEQKLESLHHVVLTTDSWNTLVRLCAKRVGNEPDSATKHLQQNP